MADGGVNRTMTLWLVLTGSVIRTILVATLAVWIGHGLLRQLQQCGSAVRRRLWLIALLTPLLIPELIVGFTYRLTTQQLTDSPWGTELLYLLLLLVRACSVSVLVCLLLPRSSVTQESLHSWQLLRDGGRGGRWNQWRLQLTGPWRRPVVAWCLTALTAFQDFETAALLQVDRHPVVWTVWLFDANAGNQLLSHSLRLIVAPVLFEVLLLLPGLLLIVGQRDSAEHAEQLSLQKRHAHRFPARVGFGVAVIVTIAAVALVVGRPLLASLPELTGGLTILSNNPAGIITQQLSTLAFSVTSAGVALSTAVLLRRWNHPVWTCLCLLPGLAGSLVLSLGLLWLFQRPGLALLWDTWLPLIVGQSLLLLPRAWVLLLILESTVSVETIHSARLLVQGPLQRKTALQLLWKLSYLRWLTVVLVLCHWCNWDVTTASILRPVAIEPIVTRLYREMHFSRTESLTALSAVTVAVPFLMAGGVLLLLKMIVSLRAR